MNLILLINTTILRNIVKVNILYQQLKKMFKNLKNKTKMIKNNNLKFQNNNNNNNNTNRKQRKHYILGKMLQKVMIVKI